MSFLRPVMSSTTDLGMRLESAGMALRVAEPSWESRGGLASPATMET
jgi:hypothetical protein